MNNQKRISVISPCFNDANTLRLHCDTWLDQDYENKELILIDDGSKDNSKSIIEKYVKKYPKLIKGIYFKTNRGACVARNEGAKIATGDVYSFLPADSFLFPGLLTAWMEMLEEHPDCGFVYGGYAFVDNKINKPTWMGGRQVDDPYMGFRFDVRELKTSNYIDGSFPIRKEVYWGAAKKVGLKDGLWNPAVKSLQDWDFWLSVVVDYGAKGFYSPSKFFETTLPHKGGLSDDSSTNWLARTKQIQSLHNIPHCPLCVCSPAAEWHGRSVAKVLDADFRIYPPLKPHDYKTIYMIGFFTSNFMWTRSHFMSPNYLQQMFMLRAQGKWDGAMPMSQAKKIVHFIGSDVLQLRKLTLEQLSVIRNFLESCEGVFCEIEAIQKELRNFGIKADVVPFPPRKWFDVEPLPKKKAIAIYLPEGGEGFYFRHLFLGLEKEKGLIHLMPDVDFHVFGNFYETQPAKAKNFKIWGKVDGVGDVIKETSAIIRIVPHDGLPISVAEWIGAGRNALTTIKMPFADHFDLIEYSKKDMGKVNVGKMMKELKKRIYQVLDKPLNTEGAKYYRKWLDGEKFKKTIAEYSKYDEKRYWEKRTSSWNDQAETDHVEVKKLKKIIAKLEFDSVLDVGCGNGRFVPYFEGKKYSGFDISEGLVKICQKRYPDKKFFTSSVEDLSEKGFDLVFVYTCLQHVRPENIEKAVEALKRSGKQMLLIEPKDFTPQGDYCYNHEYDKLFNVQKKWSLGDKWCYLIKL